MCENTYRGCEFKGLNCMQNMDLKIKKDRHMQCIYHKRGFCYVIFSRWLFEGVVRQKAEELLCLPGNATGSFLIRESPSQRGEGSNDMAVTVGSKLSVRCETDLAWKVTET